MEAFISFVGEYPVIFSVSIIGLLIVILAIVHVWLYRVSNKEPKTSMQRFFSWELPWVLDTVEADERLHAFEKEHPLRYVVTFPIRLLNSIGFLRPRLALGIPLIALFLVIILYMAFTGGLR